MTKINLITQGQQLVCANKVVVAAGDINSVQLCVEFDSAWKEYPARSATFYTSKNEAVQEMLLLNDQCIVPFEVLAESCVLFIGVRGVSADGEAVKTSSLVKYKISEGATAGDKTLTPTMDLYQQYLAALKAEADPVIAALRAEMQTMITESVQEVDARAAKLFSEIDGVVLWDSEAEGAEALPDNGTVTVSFDASEYKTFRVLVGDRETTVSEKEKSTRIAFSNDDSNRFSIIINDTGATITNQKNSKAKIIGYKY